MDVWESVEADQSLSQKGLLVLQEGFGRSLVLELGVVALWVLDVEASEETNCSVLLDGRMVLDKLLHAGFEERSHIGNSSDNVVLDQVFGVLVRDGQGDRVSSVCGSPSHGLVLEVFHDFIVGGNHGHRNSGRGNTLGAGDNVGHDTVVVLESEHLTGSSESHHDFVDMHQDSVLVAESTNTLQKSIRENDTSTGTLDGLGHDRSDIFGSFVEDGFLEHDQSGLDLFGLGGGVASGLEEEWVRVEGLDEVWGLLSEPTAGVTGGGARVGGGAVVSTVPGDNLLLAGESAGHHDSGFVGLGSTAGVDACSQVSGKNFIHELVHASLDLWLSHVSVDVRKVSKLVFGGLNNLFWEIVSKVGADGLGSPVEVSVSLVVVEVDSLSVGHVGNCVSGLAREPSHALWVLCSGLVQFFRRPGSEWLEVAGVNLWCNVGCIVFGL